MQITKIFLDGNDIPKGWDNIPPEMHRFRCGLNAVSQLQTLCVSRYAKKSSEVFEITMLNEKKYPGDELIPFPRMIITHSIIINTPTEVVWPWLVQLGAGRAGWYSYDRIDNGGTPSARRIVPELQHIEIGDIMPAVPHSKDAFIVREIQIGKALVLVVPVKTAVEDTDTKRRMRSPLRVSWALVLETLDHGRTKLISRGRVSADWLTSSTIANKKPIFIERIYGLLARMPWFLMQPIAMSGHYFMESRMLRGIKSRAEKQMHE